MWARIHRRGRCLWLLSLDTGVCTDWEALYPLCLRVMDSLTELIPTNRQTHKQTTPKPKNKQKHLNKWNSLIDPFKTCMVLPQKHLRANEWSREGRNCQTIVFPLMRRYPVLWVHSFAALLLPDSWGQSSVSPPESWWVPEFFENVPNSEYEPALSVLLGTRELWKPSGTD